MKKLLSLLLALLMAVSLAACGGTEAGGTAQSASSQPVQTETPSPTPTPTPTPEPIVATLAVAGDIMSHSPMLKDAYDSAADTYDYSPMLRYAAPYLTKATFAVGNFETTMAGEPYSGYPCFCSPDSLGQAVKDAGFDLVSTANNHAMDKGYKGLCRTLDVLDSLGVAHTGSYRTQEERDKAHGVTVADVGGISVAFLSYTYGTNGIPVKEENNFSLNRFNTDYLTNMSDLDEELISSDLAYAKSLNTDLVAVMMHWGVEYQTKENSYQDQIAQFLFDHGANLILGGHPHVLEPYVLSDQGFVCYSLGNFISAQNDQYTNLTVILNLELTKDPQTGKTTVTNVSYVPFYMLDREQGADERYLLLDLHKSIADYESGTNTEHLSKYTYKAMCQGLEDIHTILGANAVDAGT